MKTALRNKMMALFKASAIVFALAAVFAGLARNCAMAETTTIYVGQTNIVSSLDPTNTSVPWSLTSHGVSEKLYTLDAGGNLVSRFIKTLEQTGDNKWKATLEPGILFSDGTPVNAASVSECMNRIMEENAFSNATAGKIVFTPDGEFSFTIETERPTKLIKSVLCEWTYIVFKDLGNGGFTFTGPYMVEKFDPGVELSLIPNPHYPDADGRPDVVIKVFKDAGTMQLAFESGEIDMAFTVTPDVALMLKDKGSIVKDIDAGYQYFAIVNLPREPLNDRSVREAINLALDRRDMVKALRGGRVANGIFAQYYPFAGTCALKYDLKKAQEILEGDGWIEGSNGIRRKNGKPLRLRLVTYPSRPDLSIIMQIAVSQMRDLGIETTSEIVDNIDSAAQNGEYDIIFYAQHTAPTGEPSYFLNQFLREKGGKNFNKYSSAELEDILSRMGEMEQGPERDELAVRAQDVVFSDLPLLYLVDPQWHVAVSERLKDYQPYCGDYYIINDQLMIRE